MRKFKVGDRVVMVKENEPGVGMVGTVVHAPTSTAGIIGVDFGPGYTDGHNCDGRCPGRQGWYVCQDEIALLHEFTKEDNMDEYKVTGEVIRKMAEKCPTARDVLKEGFPEAFDGKWMDITGACRFSAQHSRNGVDGFYVSIDYSGEEIGWIEPWQFGIVSDNFRLMRVDGKNGGCDCFRIEKKVR
jgi:hypothetical protein